MFFVKFVLLAILSVQCWAEPEPARVFRYQVGDEAIQQQQQIDNNEKEVTVKPNGASSGRLFMRKFFFNKVFGQNQNPPVIPIIITKTDGTSPTDTSTTGTEPTSPTTTTSIVDPVSTAIDTADTATPITTGAANPINPANPTPTNDDNNNAVGTRQFLLYGRGSKDDNENIDDEGAILEDEEKLPNTLEAGDEEFIVSDEDMKSTAKANRVAPARINLRLRGSKRGQVVNVRLPANYRDYFQNGQRVVLRRTKRTRPGKRRIIRRRKNRRHNRKNKNRKNKNRKNKNRRNKRRRYVVG